MLIFFKKQFKTKNNLTFVYTIVVHENIKPDS